MGHLIMNRKEREQAKVFELVKEGSISKTEAAARLDISYRWAGSKYKRYRKHGDSGLTHRSRGKESPNKWDSKHKKLLIDLLKSDWHGFGPTFAQEKLFEQYGIKVSKETVRKAMIKSGVWIPKQKRRNHRKRRERRSMLGMMVQLDGSPHDWFEGRAGKCTLLVFIDDATSKILWLEFAKSESVASLMQATKNYVQNNGIPQLFYTDHGSVFHVNLNNPDKEKKTQWEQAVSRLGIKVQHAHSPQAKGRVERCNKTMQDRLIKEMRLAGISSIKDANNYLRKGDFIENHNKKFAIEASQDGDAHKSTEFYNLDDTFYIKEKRVLANDFTISYNKQIFQLHDQQKTIIRPKDEIIVKTSLNGEIKLWVRKVELFFSKINERKKPIKKEKKICYKPYKPSQNSKLWNSGFALKPQKENRVKPASPAAEANQ